jgi:hypothetical protein
MSSAEPSQPDNDTSRSHTQEDYTKQSPSLARRLRRPHSKGFADGQCYLLCLLRENPTRRPSRCLLTRCACPGHRRLLYHRLVFLRSLPLHTRFAPLFLDAPHLTFLTITDAELQDTHLSRRSAQAACAISQAANSLLARHCPRRPWTTSSVEPT